MQSAAPIKPVIDTEYLKLLFRTLFRKAFLTTEEYLEPRLLKHAELAHALHSSYDNLKIDLVNHSKFKEDLGVQLFERQPFKKYYNEFFQDLHCNSSTLFAFVSVWLNAFYQLDDIVAESLYIEKAILATRFAPFVNLIHKIAAMQILEIALQSNVSTNCSDEVTKFLQTHRRSIWQGGIGSTKSFQIWGLITQGNMSKATEMFENEQKTFEMEFKNVIVQNANLWNAPRVNKPLC